MRRQLFFTLLLIASAYGSAWAVDSPDETSRAFALALHAAMEDPAQDLAMQIECTNEQGIRSLHLYTEGVAIWNQQVQVAIDGKVRERLLEELLKADFPSFETHYGGKANSGRIEAPNIVMCSIQVQTGGLEKASYQDVNGERSVTFMKLAASLLDAVEPLGVQGVRANSMTDALALLKQGRLAPQILVLRVMHLPADATQAGGMLRIESGKLSRRSYQPGVNVGDWVTAPLDADTFHTVVQQLLDTEVWLLPQALPSSDTYQVNIIVLNHSLLIRSRPLNNQAVQQKTAQGTAFTALADSLLSLHPATQ